VDRKFFAGFVGAGLENYENVLYAVELGTYGRPGSKELLDRVEVVIRLLLDDKSLTKA
jgi:hypothetical protein